MSQQVRRPFTQQTKQTKELTVVTEFRAVVRRCRRFMVARLTGAVAGDDGMSTVEYAIGTVAAAAFAAVLYKIVTGGTVVGALTELVQRALSVNF